MTEETSQPNQQANQQSASAASPSVPQMPTYYDVLGLRPNASVQEIRRAYRDLSKLYHPDTTALESAIAIPKFQALNEAYATLSSPEKRLSYDYKVGFSRLSVIQPWVTSAGRNGEGPSGQYPERYPKNAYLDPTDRPLSAGEFFALFILGLTFAACLLLVVTLSLTKGDVATQFLETL
jgi:curved DNA-binding protein CbpA